jgi:hypothetical protein
MRLASAASKTGPTASSVVNDTPWLLTIAAGSVDRSFLADVQLLKVTGAGHGVPAGPHHIDQSKAPRGTSTHPYRATTLFGLSRPTTPTDNLVGMTKAHVLDCGNSRRLGPYQHADRGLQLGSALHVPTSPTDKLVGRLGLAYQRAPGVGMKDKDEPRG